MKKVIYAMWLGLVANLALGQVIQEQNLTSKEYQARFTKNVQAGYRPIKVWSKALGNVRSLNTADNPNRPINTYNLSLEKSVLDYDRPHFVNAAISSG